MSHNSSGSDPKRQQKLSKRSSSSGGGRKASASPSVTGTPPINPSTQNMKRNIGKSSGHLKHSPSLGKAGNHKSRSNSAGKKSSSLTRPSRGSSARPSSASSLSSSKKGVHSSSSSSSLGPVQISNFSKLHLIQKSVAKSRIVPKASAGGKETISRRSRARNNPSLMKHNDNLPVEASAAHTNPQKESPTARISPLSADEVKSALDPKNIYNDDVRLEFDEKVMHVLKGTPCDPERFLHSARSGFKSYLDRTVDPSKLMTYMIDYSKKYFDLSENADAYSSHRQELDNLLWDNLAFIIPMLCRQVIDVLEREEMIVMNVKPDVVVFGDIHGNFSDIHYIYQNFIINPQYAQTSFIFLGDYVDRGPKPVEILCFLFALKLTNPNRIFLLRGNHEVLKINRKYGFQHTCCHLFLDTYVAKPTLAELNYKSFNRVFCFLPVAAVIKGAEKRIFCCHGGVPAFFHADRSGSNGQGRSRKRRREMDVGWSLATLNDRVKKPVNLEPSRHGKPEEVACNEILWNDPLPLRYRNRRPVKKFYVNKKRGGHCNFFSEAGLKAFLETNGLSMVIRGHQYKCSINTGHCSDFGGALLTVFSSSNYCGTESNNTGYVHVKGPECRVQAHTLRTAQEAAKYRQFNVLKMLVDERTKAVTYVAF